MNSEAVRASIYVKDPELVEYLNSIPPSRRSSHIRELIKRDMEEHWTVVGGAEPPDPPQAPREKSTGKHDTPKGAGAEKETSKRSDDSRASSTPSNDTSPGPTSEEQPQQTPLSLAEQILSSRRQR